MNYKLTIEADYGDADYTTEVSTLTEKQYQDIEEILRKVASSISKNKYAYEGNWPCLENSTTKDIMLIHPDLTEEDIEIFSEYIPYHENGIHSIESVKILKVESEEVLL